MMAGDVLVSVVDGRLIIEGDELGNNIAITAGDTAGSIRVTGLDGTNIVEEGQAPAAEVVVDGVHRGARISLGEGDDTLTLNNLSLRGHVSIGTGLGNDEVVIGGGNVAGSALTTVDAAVHLRGLNINTGDDDDLVRLDNAVVHGWLNIVTGIGEDRVALGSQADPAAQAIFPLPVDKPIDASLHVRGVAVVDLGEGNDDAQVNQTKALAMAILGDDGVDTVSIDSSHILFFNVATGDDEDNVQIVDSAFATLGVFLGDGNDQLTTGGLSARFAILLGGSGEDTHNVLQTNDFAHEIIRGFELPPIVNPIAMPTLSSAGGFRPFRFPRVL
jgi:hypothetical protein